MSTPTITLPTPPKVLSGRETYDSIMKKIEPELLSSSLPLLKEKYKDETSENKEKRRIRYNAAFAKYYEMYRAYVEDMDMRMRRYHRKAMQSIEGRDRQREEQTLNDLTASLFQMT